MTAQEPLQASSPSADKTPKVGRKVLSVADIFFKGRQWLLMILHFSPEKEEEWIEWYLLLSVSLIFSPDIRKNYVSKDKPSHGREPYSRKG